MKTSISLVFLSILFVDQTGAMLDRLTYRVYIIEATLMFDNFTIEEIAAGQDEKLAWAGAPIEVVGGFDGDAEVLDNDCIGEGIDRSVIAGDINNDCVVDLKDVAVLAEFWTECSLPNSGCAFQYPLNDNSFDAFQRASD